MIRRFRLILAASIVLLSACSESPSDPTRRLPDEPGRILYVAEEAAWTRQRLLIATSGASHPDTITESLGRQVYFDWSAANNLIAYTSSSQSGIQIIRSDGSSVRVLVEHLESSEIRYLQWSPDGTRLLYHIGDGIFVLPAQGGTPLRIAGNTDWYASPAWSPDGREVAFSRQGPAPEFRYELWIARADGSRERRVALPMSVLHPRWSPDGRRIAFDNSQVFVVNADGSGLQVLAGDCAPSQACGSAALVEYPQWSPDGGKIAAIQSGSVVLIDVSTKRSTTVPVGGAVNPAPRWSLDGSRVAFVGHTPDGRMDIFTASREGDDIVRITTSPYDDDIPLWVR